MLAWLKGATCKPTKDYSAEQQTMPARMEKNLSTKLTSAPPVAKKKTNYSVFIYSEAAPDAKYAIYKHTRKFRVLQYIFGINLNIFCT